MRAVGVNGKTGSWAIQKVKIPASIYTLVFGDSISSGHHRTYETAYTVCDDPKYSYGYPVSQMRDSVLPAKWQNITHYRNFAHSGFSTDQIIKGGKNACGDQKPAELPQLVSILKNNADSWNWVIGSAGIDDTNWLDVLVSILQDADSVKTQQQCQDKINDWNFAKVQAHVASNILSIVTRLRQFDRTLKIVWLDYYNVANTGTHYPFKYIGIPAICQTPFAIALNSLGTMIEQSTKGIAIVVDTNKILANRNDLLQGVYPSDKIWKLAGWPHPNMEGQLQIANLVLSS